MAFGESIVVMGAGPIGLSAVQGARIMGASPIVCVEPIAVRRALALKMGATHVLDPNVEGDGLVRRVRDICSAANPRKLLGGRDTDPDGDSRGADYVVATVGADVIAPTVERGPGLFDAKSIVTATYPLERTREAFQAVGERTTTCAVVVFS